MTNIDIIKCASLLGRGAKFLNKTLFPFGSAIIKIQQDITMDNLTKSAVAKWRIAKNLINIADRGGYYTTPRELFKQIQSANADIIGKIRQGLTDIGIASGLGSAGYYGFKNLSNNE